MKRKRNNPITTHARMEVMGRALCGAYGQDAILVYSLNDELWDYVTCNTCLDERYSHIRKNPFSTPKYGERVLLCVHSAKRLRDGKTLGHVHWFAIDPPLRMGRPDGTVTEASWGAICNRCYDKHGENFTQVSIGGDVVWGRDIGGEPTANPSSNNWGVIRRSGRYLPYTLEWAMLSSDKCITAFNQTREEATRMAKEINQNLAS